jgi:hypothetical protein
VKGRFLLVGRFFLGFLSWVGLPTHLYVNGWIRIPPRIQLECILRSRMAAVLESESSDATDIAHRDECDVDILDNIHCRRGKSAYFG